MILPSRMVLTLFMMLIRPYRTAKNDIDGVVVTFVDITERKRGEGRQLLLTASCNTAPTTCSR